MDKKKVIHHFNKLGIGGTEKTTYIMLKELKNIDNTYEHYVAYKNNKDNIREPIFRELLSDEKMIGYSSNEEFIESLKLLNPFVLHRYAAGIPEWPLDKEVKKYVKHFLSTSIFGNQDTTVDISKVIYVSQHIKNAAGFGENSDHVVLRTPVEYPHSKDNMRKELSIPEDAFVFGRLGRNDNSIYDPINIKAYSKVENEKTYFIVVGPSENMKKDIREYGIKNYKYIEPTTDEIILSKFYNTIDVLAHARLDGECNPSNIWEAAAHGKPVISHYGKFFNGHIETIQNTGFVVLSDDVEEYARIMKSFINKKINYEYFSKLARSRFEQICTPDIIANGYIKILNTLKEN